MWLSLKWRILMEWHRIGVGQLKDQINEPNWGSLSWQKMHAYLWLHSCPGILWSHPKIFPRWLRSYLAMILYLENLKLKVNRVYKNIIILSDIIIWKLTKSAEGSKKEPVTLLQTLGLSRNKFNFINTREKFLLKRLWMFYLEYRVRKYYLSSLVKKMGESWKYRQKSRNPWTQKFGSV